MTGTNGAYATRSLALAAAQRLEKLIKLTEHDDFLHDTLQAAGHVITQAGLLTNTSGTTDLGQISQNGGTPASLCH
ncbi:MULTISPECIES: hypothetical protein [Sulfitobacter]|jgi:hypothetical protein|uniref:hypothetical protein n=1 Tax=Sulfitobacter TaxID=60136 RepID=UPI0019397073|nr:MULTISPECIES: hypothetical protein [Sulfitobacter]UWR17432.1 hypothetical protein K3754_19680 [Sulfitobacter sp. M368]